MSGSLRIRHLGRRSYQSTWDAMRAFTNIRDARTPDELWLTEHEPIFTLGRAGRREHVLTPGDIPVLQVERGGQVTYHGPGQLVAYPLVQLTRLGVGVRCLVHGIEQAVIDTLAHWNIAGERVSGAPGVYVAGAKIAALGLRVRAGCTFHGLALNVAMDLEPFTRINPCGYAQQAVTSLRDAGGSGCMTEVEPVLVAALSRQFGLSAVATDDDLPTTAAADVAS